MNALNNIDGVTNYAIRVTEKIQGVVNSIF